MIMLCFMSDILGKTQSLSLFLQSATIDFSSVADLIHAVCADLTELRSNDDKFNALYTEAVNLCEASGIEINFSDQTALPPARKRKIPAKFAESFVSETVGDRPDTKSKEGFQKNVCFPVLDSLLT